MTTEEPPVPEDEPTEPPLENLVEFAPDVVEQVRQIKLDQQEREAQVQQQTEDNARAVAEALKSSKEELKTQEDQARAEVAANNDAARAALQALRAGEPLLDEPI